MGSLHPYAITMNAGDMEQNEIGVRESIGLGTKRSRATSRFVIALSMFAASMVLNRIASHLDMHHVVWICSFFGSGFALQLTVTVWLSRLAGSRGWNLLWVAYFVVLVIILCVLVWVRIEPVTLHPASQEVTEAALGFTQCIGLAAIGWDARRLQLQYSVSGFVVPSLLFGVECALSVFVLLHGMTNTSTLSISDSVSWLGALAAISGFVMICVIGFGITEPVRRKGVCPSCGYDLSGLEAKHCPECGTQRIYTEHPLLAESASLRRYLGPTVLIVMCVWTAVGFVDPRAPITKRHSTDRLLAMADDFVSVSEAHWWRNVYRTNTPQNAEVPTEWALRAADELRTRWRTLSKEDQERVALAALKVIADRRLRHDDLAMERWCKLAAFGVMHNVIPDDVLRETFMQSIGLQLHTRPVVRTGAIIPFDIAIDPIGYVQNDKVLMQSFITTWDIEVRLLSATLNGQHVDVSQWDGPWKPMRLRQRGSSWSPENSLSARSIMADTVLPHAPREPGKAELRMQVELRIDQQHDLDVLESAEKAINVHKPWKTTLVSQIEVVEKATVLSVVSQHKLKARVDASRIHPWPPYPDRFSSPYISDQSASVACQVFAEHSDGSRTALGPWTEFLRGDYLLNFGDAQATRSAQSQGEVVALIFIPDKAVAERTIHMKIMYDGDPVRVLLSTPGR